ncbi:Ig-like domain-containing protein [Dokdonella sp.]|uniref:Ig-like domain-containing protein n=1 Tax=Dokdonella sp. TaxID=2291710 RepID=UPI0027B99AC1|nr:Ig-like domain-containing protein [Dokdonella sp.]
MVRLRVRGAASLVAAFLALVPVGARAQSCGVERWSVKTGTDADAGLINVGATQTNTIATLRSWPAPSPIPANNRVAPYETTVWVLNATLTEFKLETDSDIHLVLQDASGLTMIAEIPSPGCVGASSPLAAGITNARNQFQAVYTPTSSFQTVNVPVRVTGVGMFDFLHGQTGVAPNGIELHPVIDIQFNPGASNTVSASITTPSSNATVASGTAVSFAGSATDSSSSATLGYAWTFGDGGTASGASASHTYTNTGSANATYTVTFTATDNTGASGSATRTVTVTPATSGGGGTTTQILGNPGFETGAASPWVASASVVDNSTSEPAHSGSWKAWLDGYGSSHTDTLIQQVAIDPMATAAALTFWLHIDTAETSTTAANDTLKVQLRNSSGTVLATLATYSNLNANTGYAQKSFDLTAYRGQTLQVYLVGTENSSNQTSFVVDDFALNVTTSGGGGGSDTTPPTVSATETGTSGPITFSATASDNVGVTKVEFYVDGALKGTDTAAPYTMGLDSTTLANGSHSLVAKAYDAAGNAGTSSTVTFSVSNSSTTPTDLITNGGFEGGTTGWTGTTADIGSFSGESAHSGSACCWLLGTGSTATETLAQTVTLPSSLASASMSFWIHIDTAETTTTTAYDTLKVQVRNSSGTVLATLAAYSNLNAAAGYVQKAFDLSAYRGQTIQIYFLGSEDSSNQTSFVLDDVSLDVQ